MHLHVFKEASTKCKIVIYRDRIKQRSKSYLYVFLRITVYRWIDRYIDI